MKKKTVLFSVGLFGTLLGGGTTVLAADAADTMPDISNKQISVGYYHNWEAERGAGYRGGKPANLELDKINSFYNVIAVAFMKGEGIPTFKPYNISDQEFREKVAVLNNEGRVVLMSLGGADSHIELHKGEEQAFANEIIRLVERYGFDGLDIDLEQTAVAAGDNQSVIPAALKIVREHYQKENKHFIISMAPEFPYLRNNQRIRHMFVRWKMNMILSLRNYIIRQVTELVLAQNGSRKTMIVASTTFYMVFQNHSMKEAVVSSRSQQINWQ